MQPDKGKMRARLNGRIIEIDRPSLAFMEEQQPDGSYKIDHDFNWWVPLKADKSVPLYTPGHHSAVTCELQELDSHNHVVASWWLTGARWLRHRGHELEFEGAVYSHKE